MKPEYAHDFHLAADFPIAGRIVDGDGKPVAGAVVTVRGIDELADPRWHKMHLAIKLGDTNLMPRWQVDPNNWVMQLYPTAWRAIPPATTDPEGRFQLAGAGGDRAIRLVVQGPGIRDTDISVLTRDDVADFTQAIRAKYPRTRKKGDWEGDDGVQLFGPAPTIEVDSAPTVAGVVRDASTGEPIEGILVKVGGSAMPTDRHGRYRRFRNYSDVQILADDDHLYVNAARHFTDAKESGEIVADFDLPRGVLINGRVLESGTNRPIVSGVRHFCHDDPVEGGPVVAGYVIYFPLSTNTALRDTPMGQYFEGIPPGSANYDLRATVGEDGRFRIAVPPGPGVLLVQSAPGVPGSFAPGGDIFGTWKESEGLHRRYPYLTLTTRAKDDGALEGDTQSFRGLTGPIPLATGYHAYRVINPPADATTLDVTLNIPRAPSRVIRFVDSGGRAIRGATVQGLMAPPKLMAIVLDGSEAEVVALTPGEPREVVAISSDGKYTVKTVVSTDDPPARTIRLEAAGKVSGRLLDASTGRPLAGYTVSLRYDRDTKNWLASQGIEPPDAEGRFLVRSLIPGRVASISFQAPHPAWDYPTPHVHQPNSLRNLVLGIGEVRNVGNIRIKASVDARSGTKPGR